VRAGVCPRANLEKERHYGLRVDIKNFTMAADAGRGKSLVKLSNSRRMENLGKSFGGMETVLTRQMELSKW
jgi:hypothetical protein